MSGHDEWEQEDLIALQAIAALLEVDGDGEVAQAQREALAAVGEEAMAMKERRQMSERRAARRCQKVERQRREARMLERARQERAARAAARRRAADLARPDRRRVPRPEPASPAPRRAVASAPAKISLPERVDLSPAPTSREPSRPPPRAVRRGEPEGAPRRPKPSKVCAPTIAPARRPRRRSRHREPTPPKPAPVRETGAATGPALPKVADTSLAEGSPERVLVGTDLAVWRRRHGLTQVAAAKRLGVRQGTISKAEGKGPAPLGPTLSVALQAVLANELGMERNARNTTGNTPSIPE